MELLGAALAFAVTMLALSIVVTASVETIHRVLGLRENGFRVMLGHFHDEVLQRYLPAKSASDPAARGRFVEAVSRNRAPTGGARVPLIGRLRCTSNAGFLSWLWGGRRLGGMSLEDFMSRLGGTQEGAAVLDAARAAGDTAADVLVRDIAQTFDEFGREASEYFAARARLLAVCVALVIAWLCCVNPLALFTRFLASPQVSAQVAARAAELIGQADAVEQRLQATLAAARTPGGTAPPAAAPPAPSPQESAAEAVTALASLGVPIGWTRPRLHAGGFAEARILGVGVPYPQLRARTRRAVPTIAWLVLGGLLLGLGAPFWRAVVSSLTSARDAAEKARAGAEPSAADDGRLAAAITRFLTAAQARAVSGAAGADIPRRPESP